MGQTKTKRRIRPVAGKYFRKGSASDALHILISSVPLRSSNTSQEMLDTFEEVFHYLFWIYATVENIYMAIADLNSFSQGDLTETEYSNAVRYHSMVHGYVYSNDDLLGIFVAGLQESIQGSERQFYTYHLSTTLDQLASHASNKGNIQRRSIGSRTSSRFSRKDITLLTSTPTI